MASSINNTPWIEWIERLMGGVSRQAYAATFPPDRFFCLLDDLPVHLIPQRYRFWLRLQSGERLVLNPECVLLPANDLPEGLASGKEILAGFALQGTIAWVPDISGRNLLPFWLGPQLESAVRSSKTEKASSCSVESDAMAILLAARILLPESDAGASRPPHTESKASASFQAKGYAPLPDLIHPFHIASLRRYYRYLIRTGAIRLGDRQSARRYVAYNEPVARFFHQHIASTLSAVAGEPLKPSYVYLASYLSGAELAKHTDRPQCEFSVTFCLDFSPEPALQTPWPIELETSDGTVKVYQAIGDGLAYRGTRLPHYRRMLGEGQTSTSIFFHYVPADFTGSLD